MGSHEVHTGRPVVQPARALLADANTQDEGRRGGAAEWIDGDAQNTDGEIAVHQPGLFEDGAQIHAEPQNEVRAASPFDARAAWQKLLGELQLQLEPTAYHTWLHDTWVEGYEDGEFFIGTPNTYARDWLENRLRPLVNKTLKGIVGRGVDVKFMVRARRVTDAASAPPPLYAGQTGADDSRAGDSRAGDGRAGDGRAGDSRAGDGRAGDGRAGDGRAGDGRAGDGRAGDMAGPVKGSEVAPSGSLPTRNAPSAGRRFADVQTQLNPAHTFDAFVVGNSNRFAYAAAQAVAEKPGFKFNPLFVYGGVGLGKTHLLHAIGNDLLRSGHSVLYCTSEQFTNDLISAIRSQTTEQFRNKYRELDVLLIDDIQFIAGKESTQEEIFHTFNHLHASGRQVVMSSDRPPKALQLLEERLRSRFEGGIQVDVSAPDFETRVAILQTKAARMGIQVSIDVLKLIAERVDSNIRELEGALNHLFLQAQLSRSVLDIALATDSLDNVAPQRKPCSAPKLVALVAQHYALAYEELVGARRTKPIADARHVATYLLREDLGMSLPQIGMLMGGRDHTTIAHGIDKIAAELRQNDNLRHDVAILREKIYTPFIG